jgi:hypothetical protein
MRGRAPGWVLGLLLTLVAVFAPPAPGPAAVRDAVPGASSVAAVASAAAQALSVPVPGPASLPAATRLVVRAGGPGAVPPGPDAVLPAVFALLVALRPRPRTAPGRRPGTGAPLLVLRGRGPPPGRIVPAI